jgi:uncharacterized protein (TIGR02266 family)
MKWVLIVETDNAEYRYLERIISRLGYRPYRAVGTSEGLHFLSESIPNLLICGDRLSNDSPVRFCKRIRHNTVTADLPALLVTSNKDTAFRNKAIKSGFFELVYRPLSIRNFFEKLELCLSNNRRSNIRAPMSFPVDISHKNEDLTLRTHNFGEGGMYIQTEEPMPGKTKVELQFKLPGFDTLINLSGRVVHTSNRNTEEIPAGMGIQFTNLAGSLRAMLSIYMENFLAMTTPLVSPQGRELQAKHDDKGLEYQTG